MQKISQRGAVNRMVVFVASLVLVAAALAVVAWRMSNDDIDPELKQVLDNADCEFVQDQDLCKFFASWTASGPHTVEATKNTPGSTTTFVMQAENDAFRLETSGDQSSETIAIDNTVYIRDADGTWYEQTVESDQIDEYKLDNNFKLAEPTSQEEADRYTKSSTETCNERTCLTYQVEGLSDQGVMRIWFDDQEYRLRQVMITGSDGYSYDASISYGQVEIEAPSDTTVLAEGQTIEPGQTSPTQGEVQSENDSLPATGDQFDPEEYRQWLEQRQP